MISKVVVLFLVSASITGLPLTGPQNESPKFARIISSQNDLDTTAGAFSYSYETENGIKAEARGVLNNAGVEDKEEQVVTGSFSFVENGQVYAVRYVADSNGFRAYGDHIPSSLSVTSSQPQTIPYEPASPSSPSAWPLSPPPRPRDEAEDLARWQWDIAGLTPPLPPSSANVNPLQTELVYVPSRSPR